MAAGLTQRELGIRAGIPDDVASTRVNRYERGVHDPDSGTALRLAEILGVPLAALYADDPLMAEVISAVASLKGSTQAELRDYVNTLRSDRSSDR